LVSLLLVLVRFLKIAIGIRYQSELRQAAEFLLEAVSHRYDIPAAIYIITHLILEHLTGKKSFAVPH